MNLTSTQEAATDAPPPEQKIDGELSISPKTPNSQSSRNPFPVSAEVEVRISSEGFHDSWYEAIVLRHYRITRHVKYKVQYVEFVLEEGSREKLVEVVLAKDVRPRAPRRFTSNGPSFSIPNNEDEDSEIKMHDLVEAFHNDGWWHGVISGLRSPDTGLYTVSFPNSREVFQFKPADIRPQLTFANGLWSPVQRIPQKTEAYKEGDKVDVRRVRDDYGESWFRARAEKVIHHSYFLVEYESPNAHPNGDLTEILDPQHLRPAVDCMPGEILYTVGSHVEVLRGGGWCPGVVSSGLSGSSYGVTVEFRGEQVVVQFHVSNMRLRLKWDGRRWSKWVSPSKAKKRKSVNSDEISASDVSLTESVTTPDSVTSPGKKLKMERKDSLESDDEVPITELMVLAKSSKSIGNSRPIKRAVQKVSRSRKLPTGLTDFHFKVSTAKRSITCKRNLNGCAPDLNQDKVDNNGVADSEKVKDVNLLNESSSDVPQRNKNGEKETALVSTPLCKQNLCEQNLHSNTNCIADFAEETAVCVLLQDRTMGHNAVSDGQADTLTDSVHEIREGQFIASHPNSSENMEHLIEGQDKITNPSLSKFVPSVDQAGLVPLLENSVSTDPSPNSEFNQHTLAEHILINPVASGIVLPFGKASPIWKSLENTYKVFSCIPQTPHFKNLESECEEKREGTAIGMMVTYATLVESIKRLSIHTELMVIEHKIACLDSLEENGFIVDPMRSRLQHLCKIKTNCSKSALERVDLETKLAKEKDLLASVKVCEEKSADISKSIAELKEQLSIMEKQEKSVMEERARLGSAAEREHSISKIENEIFNINRSDELAYEEFGCVVSEPLY
ncbi:hypothetical protein LUZ61_020204 [Rhynchospora tenuis]|uniref:Agenet domain-containing protein n=1 Tax=Rhynchospora tenuis TaxID=198213 RepID=A0AAD5ZCV2_9POAL|nr:hypothetical protein LUZ61_020204 [Rhynchospora tenuis]